MQPLSAVITTKNDARILERTLTALQQVAAEIIAVDDHSTDATEEICKKFNVRFFTLEWSGFGPQNNFGIDRATHDIILNLRANDVLSGKAIEKIKLQATYGFSGIYAMKVVRFYFGKFLRHGTEGPRYRYVIFDRTEAKWHDTADHNKIVVSKKTERIRLRGEILQYAYHSIEEYINRMNELTSAEAIKAYARGKRKYSLKIICGPGFYFFKDFILNLGFLSGLHGFIVAKAVAQRNFLKYSKLRAICKSAAAGEEVS